MLVERLSLRVGICLAIVALCLLPATLGAQAIVGTVGGSNQADVFPSPNTGLPTPTQMNVPGLPAGAQPQGVAYYGSDNALVSDFGNSRVFVIKISTASLVSTINTSPSYNGTGPSRWRRA